VQPDGQQPDGRKLSGGAIASLTGLGVLLVFIIQNTDRVRFQFLFWTFTWPLWWYTIMTALFGALVWFGLGVMRRHRRRGERRAAREQSWALVGKCTGGGWAHERSLSSAPPADREHRPRRRPGPDRDRRQQPRWPVGNSPGGMPGQELGLPGSHGAGKARQLRHANAVCPAV